MTDADGFRRELKDFTEKVVPTRAAEVQRMMSLEVFTMIVQATPVGNHRKWVANVDRATRGLPPLPVGYVGGHARKNWQMKVGNPAAAITPGSDRSGGQAIGAASSVAAGIKQPTRVYIVNPLPYIDRLENGWSKQAPRGMVKIAVAAIVAKYGRTS